MTPQLFLPQNQGQQNEIEKVIFWPDRMTEEVRTGERIKHSLNSFRLFPERACINFQAVSQIRYMYERLFFLCRLLNILQNKLCCTPQGGRKKVGLARLWRRDNSNKNLDEHIAVESTGQGNNSWRLSAM